jgi:hypothetical protein
MKPLTICSANRKLSYTDLLAAIVIYVNGAKGVAALQLSLLTWFVVDSSASAFGGNAVNIIPNIVVLLVLIAPMFIVRAEQ